MPTTRADSYSAASGGGIYAGVDAPANIPASGVARTFAMIGDSMNSLAFGGGAIRWVNGMMGAPFILLANSAFNGRTLFQLSGELANSYKATETPGLGGLPALGWLFIEIGTATARGTDDSPGVELTPELEGYFHTLVDDALNYAEVVVLGGLQPLGGVGDLANKSACFGRWNAFIENLAVTHASGRVYYIYDGADLADENGAVYTQFYLSDRGHNNDAGNRQRALSSLSQWQALLANQSYASRLVTDAADVYPATTQWNPNVTMSGTGGTKGSGWSGTLPDGFYVETYGVGLSGSCSIVAADVGDANQVPWLRITQSTTDVAGAVSLNWDGSGRTLTDTDPETLDQLIQIRFNSLTKAQEIWYWTQSTSGQRITEIAKVGWSGNDTLTETITLHQKQYRLAPTATGGTKHYLYLFNSGSGGTGSLDIRCPSVRG